MKRLTGKKLLLKLEQLRNKRADLILSATGYLESGANLRYQSQFRDYEEFFTEFFWAYVEENGFPEKLEGNEYYKNFNSRV